MKSLFILLILYNFNEIMTRVIISNKTAIGGNKYSKLSFDNPNFKQALFSHAFIASSRSLFSNKNKDGSIKYITAADEEDITNNNNNNKNMDHVNNKMYHPLSDKYHHAIVKSEGTPGKNKEGDVGYYSMDVGGVDVDLESLGYSLMDTSYRPVNSRRHSRYTAHIPVQCMRLNGTKLLCVHGNYIYKLKLPSPEISEEEIGKLVETVYKEIELKHIKSFNADNDNRLVKREITATKGTCYNKNDNSSINNECEVNTSPKPENTSKIVTFSLPVLENRKRKKFKSNNVLFDDINSFQRIYGITETPIDQIPERPDYFSEQNKPPMDLSPSEELLHTYSSKWLSKRHLNNNHINMADNTGKHNSFNPSFILLKKRRIIPPKCFTRSRTMPTKHSVNDGKTGKCHFATIKCTRTSCECSHEWPKIPERTTCPPTEPIECVTESVRCPACPKRTTEWWCTIENNLAGINETAPAAPKFVPICTTPTCSPDDATTKVDIVTSKIGNHGVTRRRGKTKCSTNNNKSKTTSTYYYCTTNRCHPSKKVQVPTACTTLARNEFHLRRLRTKTRIKKIRRKNRLLKIS